MKTLLASLLFLALASAAEAQTFTISGTMRHSNVEGGCWYLETADSQHYELFGDTAIIRPLHVVGLTTRLSVEHMKGVASICMIGDIVRVVERLDGKRTAHDPNFQSKELVGTVHRTKLGTWYVKTDHARYEFQSAPAAEYRHVGAAFHRHVAIILGRNATREKMDGLIMPDKPSKRGGALHKRVNSDPR